ncbi:MAG: GC-type dockerin domain-anchored protein, partial [Flavobacteriales bacterium]
MSVQTNAVYSTICEAAQPDWGTNICDYPFPSVFMLFSVSSTYKYYSPNSVTFESFSDGTATITFDVQCVQQPGGGLSGEVHLANGLNWADWIAQPEPHSFKADCNGTTSEHENWMYYIVQPTSYCVGTGDFAGTTLALVHAPSNLYFGYQLGLGASNYSADYGSGGWLFANGTFVDTANSYSHTGGHAADFMLKHECEESAMSISNIYTATDACGNESQFTQQIIPCNVPNPVLTNMPLVGTTLTMCELEAWQPQWVTACNDLQDESLSITFTSVEDETSAAVQTSTTDGCGNSAEYNWQVMVTGSLMDCAPANTCPADYNGDGVVTYADVQSFIGAYASHNLFYDITGEGQLNTEDLVMLLSMYGTLCD